MDRERWKTRIGLILAAAGSAVGLGNFLRFPVQCAANGGGAFMIPYFLALFILGVPLMWVEWAMGRYGGSFGHGSTPGMFHRLWKHPLSKYLGAIGLLITFGIAIYYVYLESWTLGYTYFSLTGKYFGITSAEGMKGFLSGYQGVAASSHFSGIGTAYIFFLIAFALNVYVVWHGISGGIERFSKIAMPLLFLFALVLVVRVFTLGTPDPSLPENNALNGLGFVWNPQFSKLTQAKVWMAAAGQIFFTLSVGFGCLHTYASYLRKNDDVALNGFSTAVTNEFAEVICGGSIAIPVAVAFFGLTATTAIAAGGSFNLGFQAMPLIFQRMPLGEFFGTLWFLLLFFAGITSSVSLVQPVITFFQDEFGFSRKRAVAIMSVFWFILAHPVIFYLAKGYLDEMDFWLGTLGCVFFGLIEAIIFMWVFGPKNAWGEITRGADMRVPRFFLFILKYVTPVYLLLLFVFWARQEGANVFLLKGVPPENVPYVLGARAMMLGLFVVISVLVFVAFKRRARREQREMS